MESKSNRLRSTRPYAYDSLFPYLSDEQSTPSPTGRHPPGRGVTPCTKDNGAGGNPKGVTHGELHEIKFIISVDFFEFV